MHLWEIWNKSPHKNGETHAGDASQGFNIPPVGFERGARERTTGVTLLRLKGSVTVKHTIKTKAKQTK